MTIPALALRMKLNESDVSTFITSEALNGIWWYFVESSMKLYWVLHVKHYILTFRDHFDAECFYNPDTTDTKVTFWIGLEEIFQKMYTLHGSYLPFLRWGFLNENMLQRKEILKICSPPKNKKQLLFLFLMISDFPWKLSHTSSVSFSQMKTIVVACMLLLLLHDDWLLTSTCVQFFFSLYRNVLLKIVD